MCGIAAIIDPRAAGEDLAAIARRSRDLRVMLERIRHRGDEECFAESAARPGVAFGTNRLAIVDREHARQPQCDPDGLVEVVYNGELYGFQDLRAELEALGRTFSTTSDTEILIHAYLQWGVEFIDRLDGMYAFVLHDRRTGDFLAARDHIGIKPLYHAVKDGVHYFASEQKCLLGYVEEIDTVPPGSYLLNGGAPVRHFELSEEPPELSEAEVVARYRELFDDAVRKQVDTDLPVAVLFSGGIDSAVVLEAARRFHPNVTAFTVGFEGAADIEVAKRYCAENGIPHVVSHLDRDALVEAIGEVAFGAEFFEAIDVMDSCVAYFAYRLVKEHGFKVALCGEGSDEVLAGYDLFKKHPDPLALMRYRVGNLHRTDLQRVDRTSMLNSVETRVPFMDRFVLQFGYSVPMSLKIRDGVEKWVLRQAFKDSLPAYIADRPKVRMPDGSGLKNTLMEYARQTEVPADEVSTALGIDTTEGRFFLREYLKAGYPVPRERFKTAGFDYSPNGYFEFIS
ncbi:asparagine synthetase B family protein [Kitasatospora sp. LaBMicrA B282]|uniref:asparagine synthetase B family protein n=1 Tax=Kitasatospora sp. LaBMicrA B282 TaxID=3420949 RepID=UPI003D09BEDB